MKNLIVNIGILILLLSFPLQYALDQHNHNIKTEFQYYVNTAKEEAKQKGYFTDEIIEDLKNKITTNLHIPESKIVINVTRTPKYRTNVFDERELIHYEIMIPISKIIAVNKLWGISDADNRTMYPIRGTTTSEAIIN
jgi:hypothetical protein